MKRLVCTLILLLSATALCQDTAPVKSQETRFLKAECGTAADYLELGNDGTYRLRKTVNVQQQPYEGTKEHYKGTTFITFKTEDSAGIVIPSEDTKRQLDGGLTTRYPYRFSSRRREKVCQRNNKALDSVTSNRNS
jgi:hypothetical protein